MLKSIKIKNLLCQATQLDIVIQVKPLLTWASTSKPFKLKIILQYGKLARWSLPVTSALV